MTALDDLDSALARMQGDDSGGPLGPALEAARRVRVERAQLTDAETMVGFAAKVTQRVTSDAETAERERRAGELRIRREVRALAFPMLAGAAILVSDRAYAWWAQLGYAVFALTMMIVWTNARPTLPGDTRPAWVLASMRAHPVLWTINAAFGVGTGVSFGLATTYRGDDPAGTFWLIAAVLLLVVTGGWFTFLVSRTRAPASRGSES